jgi:aldehyde:ferredoxin oxidoreductase
MAQLLYVDLTRETMRDVRSLRAGIKIYRGTGVDAMIVSNLVNPIADPIREGNVIVFAPRLLTGTGFPTGTRYDVVTKAPLNNTLTSANSGGVVDSSAPK